MKLEKMLVVGTVVATLVVPVQFVLAGPGGTTIEAHEVGVPKQEYALRLLEDQVQVLRNKLYLNRGKMSDKEKSEWHKRYQQLRATLNTWNDSIDGVH